MSIYCGIHRSVILRPLSRETASRRRWLTSLAAISGSTSALRTVFLVLFLLGSQVQCGRYFRPFLLNISTRRLAWRLSTGLVEIFSELYCCLKCSHSLPLALLTPFICIEPALADYSFILFSQVFLPIYLLVSAFQNPN